MQINLVFVWPNDKEQISTNNRLVEYLDTIATAYF